MFALIISIFAFPSLSAVPPGGWQTSTFADHVLAGQIWSVSEEKFVDVTALLSAVQKARFIMLGEKHDNADHHRLQAWILNQSATSQDTVIFEMLSETEAPGLSESWQGAETDMEALGQALQWEERGWFTWSIYRPIFEAIASTGAQPKSGDLPRTQRRAVSRSFDVLGEGVANQWGLETPLEPAAKAALERHIIDGHCDLLPEAAVGPVMNVQRARDASLANALLSEQQVQGRRYLISGGGHARADYGVPWYLGVRGVPREDILVVVMREVDETSTTPETAITESGGLGQAADFVWFTPRVDNEDPCEKYAEQLKSLKKQ